MSLMQRIGPINLNAENPLFSYSEQHCQTIHTNLYIIFQVKYFEESQIFIIIKTLTCMLIRMSRSVLVIGRPPSSQWSRWIS